MVPHELAGCAEIVEGVVMDKEGKAIERLQLAAQMSETYYEEPLIITTSGGKDSDVCLHLAQAAGINYEVQHNHTTADAPETVRHVRETFRRLEEKGIKCTINWPTYRGQPVTMWSLIPQKLMPPTRLVRYCCAVLKEQGGKDRMICTGVRWAESTYRKNGRAAFEKIHRDKHKVILVNDNDECRKLFENCQIKGKRTVNPIIDWTDSEVWDYIRSEKVETNPVYCEGWHRVGCIGCPMARRKGREAEFARWPTYQQAYIRAFDKMNEYRRENGKKTYFESGIDVFRWWMEYDVLPGQMDFDEVMNDG